jgi:hypothetical protein
MCCVNTPRRPATQRARLLADEFQAVGVQFTGDALPLSKDARSDRPEQQ